MTTGTSGTHVLEAAPLATTTLPKRRLSRQVAADTVAIGDLSAIVFGGLLPALIYAVVGNVQLDQILLLQSTILAGFIAHLCLRFRGMYETARMDKFPQAPIELFIAVCCGLIGVLSKRLAAVLLWPTSITTAGRTSF